MLALDNNYLRDYFNDTGLFGGEKITDESLANPSILQVTNLTRVFLTKTRFHPTAMDCVLHLIQHMSPVDWLLFLNKPDYREHRFHQFRVALVALWLFDQITKGRLDIRYPRDKVAGALWVAAILHDHGLALSRFAQLRPCLTSGGDTGLTGSGAEMLARLRGCYEGLYAVSLVREYCDACDAVPPADEPARDQSESVRATLRRYLEQVGMDEPFLIRLSGDDEKLYDHGLWSAVNLSASLCQFGMPWRFVADEDRDLIRMVIHGIIMRICDMV